MLFRSQREGHLVHSAKSLDADERRTVDHLIGSVASVKGTPAFGAYGATKAAVRNLVRAWELKDRRIRSNVLSPGPIKTPLVDLQPPEAIAKILTTIPMGRMGEPDEVAKAALFLASDDSSFVTGIELFVDGGRGQV
jgi:NAD(P)-dependent dehydrogenase (short-subunit alcohol dehydrogenase family)